MQEFKIYNPYLSESMFFKPEQMYGEDREIFKKIPHIEKGNIYFLAERNRVRVNPESIKISIDAKVSLEVIIENSIKKNIKIEAAPLFIDLGKMFRRVFGDSKMLQKNMVTVTSHQAYMDKLEKNNSDYPMIGLSYVRNLQNKKNVPLRIHTPDKKFNDLQFTIHSILSEYGISIGDFPKILYIGKSEKLDNRIYRHEKIQEALALVDDENDIYLYSFQFDDSRLRILETEPNLKFYKKETVDDISNEDRIALVEMALINYFQPKMNRDYVDSDLNDSEIFQRALYGKYQKMIQEIDHEGVFWNFGSEKVKPALRHEIEYPVNC